MAAKRKLGKLTVAEPTPKKAKIIEVPDSPLWEDGESVDIDKTLESPTIKTSLDQS